MQYAWEFDEQSCRGRLVAGVDEVGRGPLAGAVVAAAVILDREKPIDGLMDSKKLSEKKREQLFGEIKAKSIAYAIGRAEVQEIDAINILQASLLAMQRAVNGLPVQPALALIDGNRCPDLPCRGRAIVKGDSQVAEIAAAAILAKVIRDNEMRELDGQYPGYGFAKHKGYPTREHMLALTELGVSPIHRVSFGPVKRLLQGVEVD